MVDRDATNGAPRNIRSFKAVAQAHDIVCAARRLPVVKPLRCHAGMPPNSR